MKNRNRHRMEMVYYNPTIEEGHLELNLRISISGDFFKGFSSLAKDQLMLDISSVLDDFRESYLPDSSYCFRRSDVVHSEDVTNEE